MEDKELLTVIDVSRLLGLPLSRVRNISRIYANRIPMVIKGGERLYPREAVEIIREVAGGSHKAISFGGVESDEGAGLPNGEIGEIIGNGEGIEDEAALPEPPVHQPPAAVPSWAVPAGQNGPPAASDAEPVPDEVYYSVSKISQMTDIPESKLLEYRRKFGARIPSAGRGKDRVHPESAIPIFQQIHKEATGEQITVRNGKRLFDLKELCDQLGLSRSLVYSYISEEGDRIPKTKDGKRWLFPQESAEIIREIRREREDRKRRRVEGYYSIRDISRITGISESTLHQYKRRAGEQIPSVGRGRDRKYPEDAIEIFRKMRDRGGPGAPEGGGCYSLAEVSSRTGIPKHTLLYYRRAYPGEIPLAEGRKNRVYNDASIEAFVRLRERSGRRGRRVAGEAAGFGGRIGVLEDGLGQLTEIVTRIAQHLGIEVPEGRVVPGGADDSEE